MALTADIFRYLLWQVLGATTVPYVVNNESFIAHDLLSAVDFEKVCFLTRASSARGVSFSSSSLFSSAQVSAPSTPPPRTLVQMPCPHLRANVRFRSPLFLHMLTVPLTPPFPRAISVRGDNAAKPPDGSRQRIRSHYNNHRESRDSRGRRNAQDASADRPSLRAGMEPASYPLARSSLSGSATAYATAAAAPPSLAAGEAAQPKPGAISYPQRAPMRPRSTGSHW